MKGGEGRGDERRREERRSEERREERRSGEEEREEFHFLGSDASEDFIWLIINKQTILGIFNSSFSWIEVHNIRTLYLKSITIIDLTYTSVPLNTKFLQRFNNFSPALLQSYKYFWNNNE
jgi:hypothetical protein